MNVKVNQMESRNGNKVPNQFEIYTKEGIYFQSYDTIIAFKEFGTGDIYLDEDSWDYSVTTGKYRNEFLHSNIADTRKKIKSGEFKLINLNLSF